MLIGEKLETGPSVEPVLKAAIKTHLRISHSDDDTYIDGLATAARQRIEDWTGRALITQTWDLYLDDFPVERYIRIPRPPLQSVTHLKYYLNEVLTTWDSGNYIVDIYKLVGRLWLAENVAWPTADDRPNAVEIQYVAGYGDASTDVPNLLLHAITWFAAHLYENRLPVDMVSLNELPMGLRSIVHQYQVHTV